MVATLLIGSRRADTRSMVEDAVVVVVVGADAGRGAGRGQRARRLAAAALACAALVGVGACGGGGGGGGGGASTAETPAAPGANVDPNATGVVGGSINRAKAVASDAESRDAQLTEQGGGNP
jgi:hypothetical protein